jgi:hypothetical protein
MRKGRPRKDCDAHKVFKKNSDRASAFLVFFDRHRKVGRPDRDANELLRGTVVFAVGALDAFLHDLILEIVPSFGQKSADLKGALKDIARDDPSLALKMSLAPTPTAARAEFRTALDDWLSTKSFQGRHAVVRAASFVGLKLDWNDLNRLTRVDTATELDRFTRMRHGIVHRGQKPSVRRSEAEACVMLVTSVAGFINDEVVRHYHRR